MICLELIAFNKDGYSYLHMNFLRRSYEFEGQCKFEQYLLNDTIAVFYGPESIRKNYEFSENLILKAQMIAF